MNGMATQDQAPPLTSQGESPDLRNRIRALIERPEGRRPEELLDQIAGLVGSPRRFGGRLYQKSLG